MPGSSQTPDEYIEGVASRGQEMREEKERIIKVLKTNEFGEEKVGVIRHGLEQHLGMNLSDRSAGVALSQKG